VLLALGCCCPERTEIVSVLPADLYSAVSGGRLARNAARAP